MKEDFDFDKVGKRTPYQVPAGFFDQITESTLSVAEARAAAGKKPAAGVWKWMAVAASVAVVLMTGYFWYTGNSSIKNEMMAGADRTEVPGDTFLIASPAPSVVSPDVPTTAPQPKAETDIIQQQPEQQVAQAERQESFEEILAGISDEELLQLAEVAKSDLYVYEQTID